MADEMTRLDALRALLEQAEPEPKQPPAPKLDRVARFVARLLADHRQVQA